MDGDFAIFHDSDRPSRVLTFAASADIAPAATHPIAPVGKRFDLTIQDKGVRFARNGDSFAAEAALDGVYIIRTSVCGDQMDTAARLRRRLRRQPSR